MTLRWPFNTKKHKQWVGISLSTLAPSAVIYSQEGVVDSVTYNQDQGFEDLELWLKKHVSPGMPAVLVLDEADYELLLVEAPSVPDAELNAAIEFKIGDLLNQPVEDTAIQAVRLPSNAYRGRMSMAYVVACPNNIIKEKVDWASKNHLEIETITVPEFSLLNLLAASAIEQGIALLELTPRYGTIRLYQEGALYLTRQVEVGLDALDIQNDTKQSNDDQVNEEDDEPLLLDEVSLEEVSLEETTLDEELVVDEPESTLDFNVDSYVGFSPKPKVNAEQTDNLVLEVQRSLDYYESQIGMGQVTQLWVMAGGKDLTPLINAMQSVLTANIEQPNIAEKLKQLTDINILHHEHDMNNSVLALGGALAHVAS